WLTVAFTGLFLVPFGLMWATYVRHDNHFPIFMHPWDNWTDGVFGCPGQEYPGWKGYIWTALRNPCSNFGKLYLGITAPTERTLDGNPYIGPTVGGYYWCYGENGLWEYRLTRPYTMFGIARCFNIRIGWKLRGDGHPKAPFVFRISPFNVVK
ncbi:MAG: hypothetical protein NTW48_09945, partial [Chloroflexi bacterium]|nr:hypothetical protein [Chloroflexota bacterium]